MMGLALILAAAALAFALSRWSRLPAPPLLILAGMSLEATGLLGPGTAVRDVMALGLSILVFVLGAELDLARVGAEWRAALRVGVSQFCAQAAVGCSAALLLGFDPLAAFYIGLAVTASSTLMIVPLLSARQQLFEPFGRLVLGVLLLQDLLAVLALAVLVRSQEGAWAMASGAVETLGLLGLAIVWRRWLSPWLIVRLKLDDEARLLVVLSTLFIFVGAAFWMGLPLVSGAFMAGVAMSRFPVRGVVAGQLTSLTDFFLAVFFVTLGAAVSFPGTRQVIVVALVLAGVLLLTTPLIILIARGAGMTMRSAIESAHLLAQSGELGLVVGLLGLQQGHIDDEIFATIVLIAAATMVVSPFLATDAVTWRLMRWLPLGRRREAGRRYRDHVVILGCGQHTRRILDRLLAGGETVVVVDDDAGVVAQLRHQGITAIRGDGADLRVLRWAGAPRARAILSTMRRMADNERLLSLVSGATVLVRVFAPEDGRHLAALGAIPIAEAEAGAREFMSWYDAMKGRSTR